MLNTPKQKEQAFCLDHTCVIKYLLVAWKFGNINKKMVHYVYPIN